MHRIVSGYKIFGYPVTSACYWYVFFPELKGMNKAPTSCHILHNDSIILTGDSN